MPNDEVTFAVRCTMKARWVPYFLGMLKKMQWLGGVGSSREVTFFSDGDGGFRPTFVWSDHLPQPEEGGGDESLYFDAG